MPEITYQSLQHMVGRTIASVEIARDPVDGPRHPGEHLHIVFTDTTAVDIIVGANFGWLDADIHTDLMAFFHASDAGCHLLDRLPRRPA